MLTSGKVLARVPKSLLHGLSMAERVGYLNRIAAPFIDLMEPAVLSWSYEEGELRLTRTMIPDVHADGRFQATGDGQPEELR